MSWSRHAWARAPHSVSTRRRSEKALLLMAIAILSLLPAMAGSAVGFPLAPAESGGDPTPGKAPERPLGSAVPRIPPSRIDPGIQHVPEKQGDPRAAVKPPNLDQGISTNPDVAPSAQKDSRGTPQGKPSVR